MKSLLALLLVALLSACAATAVAPEPAPRAALPLPPAAVTRWHYIRSVSYEAQNPGLGVSHRYDSAIGWADVYVYGLQRGDWLPGVDDRQFDAHFKSTIDEVRQQAARGTYAGLKIGPVHDVRIAGQVFRSVGYQYARAGKPHESLTFLTAWRGRLLKYRMTFAAPAPDNLEAIAHAFVEANLRASPDAPPDATGGRFAGK